MCPHFLPAFAEQLSLESLFRRVRSDDKEVQNKLADRASKLEAKLHHANEMLKHLKDDHEAATEAESDPPLCSRPISRKPDLAVPPTPCGSSSDGLRPHKSFHKTTTFQVQTGIQKAIARLDSKSKNKHQHSETEPDDVVDEEPDSDESESNSEDKTLSSNSDDDEDSSESDVSSSPS